MRRESGARWGHQRAWYPPAGELSQRTRCSSRHHQAHPMRAHCTTSHPLCPFPHALRNKQELLAPRFVSRTCIHQQRSCHSALVFLQLLQGRSFALSSNEGRQGAVPATISFSWRAVLCRSFILLVLPHLASLTQGLHPCFCHPLLHKLQQPTVPGPSSWAAWPRAERSIPGSHLGTMRAARGPFCGEERPPWQPFCEVPWLPWWPLPLPIFSLTPQYLSSLALLAALCPVQPNRAAALFVARALCWLLFSSVPTRTPGPSVPGCFQPAAPSRRWCWACSTPGAGPCASSGTS